MNAQEFDWAGQLGYNGNQEGHAITVDAQGNVYSAGYFIAGIDLDPTAGVDTVLAVGGQDGYVVKQANDGTYLWGAHFRGNCLPTALARTPAGNILVVGTFTGTVDFDPGSGVANMVAPASTWYFVCSLASDGTYQWAKKFGCNQPVYDPAVAVDASGNIHLTGTFTNTMDADPGDGPGDVFDLISFGGNDVFITTLDAQGNFVRAMSFGDTGDDRGRGIATDAAGNVYVAGYFAGDVVIQPFGVNIMLSNISTVFYCDAFVLKLDAAGIAQWALSFGGQYYDRAYAIAVNAAQEVFVAGGAGSAADLDPGPGQFLNLGSDAAFYLKLDANGGFMHAATSYYNNLSDAHSTSIALDTAGNIHIAGLFNGYGVDFDPGPGSTNYDTNGNSYDGFIAVYAEDGTYLWSRQLGSLTTGQEMVNALAVDAVGSCYMTGSFSAAMDFDPGVGQFVQTPVAAGYLDAFLLKLDPIGLDLREERFADGMRAFPIPTTGPLTVALADGMKNAAIRVSDLSGRTLLTRQGLSGDRYLLDLTGLPAGMYVLEVTDGNARQRRTIIRD